MLLKLLRLFAWLPLWLFHAIGIATGWLVWAVDSTYRRRLAANLRQSGLAKNDADYTRLLRSSIAQHGKAGAEMLVHWLRPVENVSAMVKSRDGWALVEAALAQPRPVIFVSPHLGAIEVCGAHLAVSISRQLAALYRPPRLAFLEPLMLVSRGRANALAAPANAKGVRLLFKTLKAGQAVYLLPDQAPGSGDGVWAPFFGKPAYTMTLLTRMALQFDATVLMCFAERLSWGRGYRLHVKALPALTGEPAVDASTVNAAVEDLIARAPDQYLWSYNRYKRPAGAPAPEEVAP